MASLNSSNLWLTNLIEVGADAMTNLYFVDFSTSSGIGEDNEQMFTVRLSNISGLPSFNHKTEPKKFMTVDFDAPVDDFDFEKKLTLEFRLDQNYKVYDKLMEIMGKTSKPSLGYATTRIGDPATNETRDDHCGNLTIRVNVPDNIPQNEDSAFNHGYGNTGFKNLYTFEYCWISKISGLESFSSDSTSPRTVKAEVYYYAWTGPTNSRFVV